MRRTPRSARTDRCRRDLQPGAAQQPTRRQFRSDAHDPSGHPDRRQARADRERRAEFRQRLQRGVPGFHPGRSATRGPNAAGPESGQFPRHPAGGDRLGRGFLRPQREQKTMLSVPGVEALSRWQVTATSNRPLRPNRVRSTASATSSSPSRAGATKAMSKPAATTTWHRCCRRRRMRCRPVWPRTRRGNSRDR